MKFLIIQENGRHEENRYFRECFSLQKGILNCGEECVVWGLGHNNFTEKIDFNSFDVIINLENYDETGWVPDLSKITTPYKFLWSIDAHVKGIQPYLYEFKRGNYQQILQSSLPDITRNSVWFPNCFDDSLIGPRKISKRGEVGFCGNILNRAFYMNVLKENFKFIADIFVLGESMVQAINSYMIHFNMNISYDINYRNFETIGCGIPLITNYNEQYLQLGFKDEVNCLMYNNKEELIEKIRHYLYTEKLNVIGDNGLQLSKKHTYNNRAKHLIKFVNNIKH